MERERRKRGGCWLRYEKTDGRCERRSDQPLGGSASICSTNCGPMLSCAALTYLSAMNSRMSISGRGLIPAVGPPGIPLAAPPVAAAAPPLRRRESGRGKVLGGRRVVERGRDTRMKKWSATRHEEAPVLALFRGCIPPTHEQALSAPGQDPPRFLQWFSGQLESQSTAVLLSEDPWRRRRRTRQTSRATVWCRGAPRRCALTQHLPRCRLSLPSSLLSSVTP